jgi:hypothetical protein
MSFKHFIEDRGGLMFLIGANGINGCFKQLMRAYVMLIIFGSV